MKRLLLIFLLFRTIIPLMGQDGYIVKLDLSLNNNCCGACNEFSVKSIVIKNKNTGEIYWDGYWAYRSGFSTSMYISCSVGNVINVSGSGIKNESYSFDVSVVKGETRSNSYKSEDNGIFWHNSTVSVSTFGYGVPRIVSFSGNANNCVSSENSSSYTFNLETTNTVIQSALEGQYYNLLIEVADNQNFTNANSFYINDKSTSYTCSYRTIAGMYANNWYGKDLYFRTLIHFSNPVEIYKSAFIYGPRRFYRQMPPITNVSIQRTACQGDVVTMTLDPSVIAAINNYHFRAKRRGYPEETSNIVHLTKGSTSGNTLSLTVTSGSQFLNGYYDFQVFGIELGKDTHSDNIGCATLYENKYIPVKPSYLSITATPIVKATFDGISYHVSRYGASDGEITLQVTGGSGSRIDRFVYWNNGSWETIPASQLVYVNSTTRRFTGLVANRSYYLRVYDTDGCVQSGYITVPALRQPADITLNQPTASVVTCHVNNTGTGSKSDGIIRADFSGGIGNYTARLYNNAGSLLETKTVTASDKSGSYYYAQFSPRGVSRYRVRVTDIYGVYKEQYIDVTSNPEVILSATPTDLTCYENSSGSVQLSVSNKRTTYATYELTGESSKYITGSSTSFSGLSAGTYTAMVTNTDGCRDVVNNISVGQPNDIVISPTGSKIARYGDNTGTINLDIREGTGNFDYTVYNHSGNVKVGEGTTSQNATIPNLYDGYYWVEVTDDNGCPQTHSNIRVRQPDAPLELSFSQQPQNIDCYGNATGEVYPTATGGWGHYQYGFNGTVHGTSNTIGGLTATGAIADTVFVVDSAGVIEKLPVTITEPTQLVSSIDNIYNLNCFEDNSGAVKLNISGGTPGYRVSMNNSTWVSGDSLFNLSAGNNQTIYIQDANNCPESETVSITQPDLLDGEINKAYDLLCYQDATGAVKLDIAGGTTPYAISVDKTSWFCSDSIGGLQANANQDVWVRDNHGCYDSLVTSISQPDLLEATPSVEHLRCFEDNSGEIDMTVLGGTAPYRISIDSINWLLGNFISGMAANPAQNVYVRDDHNCVTKNTVAINQPEELTTAIDSIYHLRCFNDGSGAVDLDIHGGTAPYSISDDAVTWINGNYLDNLNANPSLTLFVKDNNDCETNRTVTITQPNELEAEIGNVYNLKCFEDNSGALKLNIQGGTTPYEISNDYSTWVSGDSLSNLAATNASDFYIKDNHNCETSVNTTITQPDDLQIGIDSVIDAYCNQNNGKINVSVDGGTISNNYSYTWQYIDSMQYLIAQDVLQNIYSGQYKLSIADDNSCKESVSILVSDLDGPVLNAWHSDSVTCFGGNDGAIYIDNVSGGGGMYTYYLNGQEFVNSMADLVGGEHHFKIIDNKNCVVNEYLEVSQPDSLGYSINKSIPTCNGIADGAFSLSLTGGNGGYNYSWADGETSLSRSNLKSAWYLLSVSDKLGCTADFNIFLDEPKPLVATASIVYPLCSYSFDGRIVSTPNGGNGGYKFNWNTGGTTATISQLSAGVYSLRLTDAKNCIVDTSFTLLSPDTLIINPVPVNPSCFGDANGAISTNLIGGTGSYKYWWNTGSTAKNISGLRKGTYSLTVRDANNCQVSGNYTLNEPDKLSLIANIIEPTCNGYNNGSISIETFGGNGGYVYQWNTNDNTSDIAQLIKGEYSLTVTDSKNCNLTKVYSVNEPAPVTIQANVIAPTCHDSEDGIIQLNANGGSGGYSFKLNGNSIGSVINNLSAGSYPVIATDINYCTGVNEFVVDAPLPPTANLDHNVGVLCTGNSLELDGGDFISYQWYKDAVLVSEDRFLTVDQTGQYTLRISNQLGCIGIDTFDLEVSDTPLDAKLLLQDSAMVDEVVRAIDVTWPVPDSIQWYFDYPVELVDNNNYSQKFSSNNTGTINVTLRAWYGGCFSDSSKSVTIYYEEGGIPQKSAMNEPLILGYRAYPNPNDGDFYIGVELSRKADISLHLFNVGSGSAIDINRQYGLESYEVPFNLTGLKPGVYIILLVAEHEQQKLKIVIE